MENHLCLILLIGKPSINGPFPMAMLKNQRVYIYKGYFNKFPKLPTSLGDIHPDSVTWQVDEQQPHIVIWLWLWSRQESKWVPARPAIQKWRVSRISGNGRWMEMVRHHSPKEKMNCFFGETKATKAVEERVSVCFRPNLVLHMEVTILWQSGSSGLKVGLDVFRTTFNYRYIIFTLSTINHR